MLLEAYKRPDQDNGRGLHWFPNGDHSDPTMHRPFLEEARQMGIRWATTLNMQQGIIALFHEYGITPIIRPPWQIDHGWEDYGWLIQWQVANYGYAYWQIFNENRDNREWSNGQENLMVWAANTLVGMENVSNNGGYPGVQTLDPGDLRYLIRYAREQGKLDLFEKAWFSNHNYANNHSVNFPYDSLNPGLTVYDDAGLLSTMSFLAFDRVIVKNLGRHLPIICTEGGYRVGDDADNRYPTITEAMHVEYNLAMYEMFRTRIMPNGEPLPDYVFAVCPWLVTADLINADPGFADQGWWQKSGPKLIVAATKALPAFERKFSWDDATPPTEEKPPMSNPIWPLDFAVFAEKHKKMMAKRKPASALTDLGNGRATMLLDDDSVLLYVPGKGSTRVIPRWPKSPKVPSR